MLDIGEFYISLLLLLFRWGEIDCSRLLAIPNIRSDQFALNFTEKCQFLSFSCSYLRSKSKGNFKSFYNTLNFYIPWKYPQRFASASKIPNSFGNIPKSAKNRQLQIDFLSFMTPLQEFVYLIGHKSLKGS